MSVKHRIVKKDRKSYFLLYTICFCVTCMAVFIWYFITGRTFIWELDGWAQHYKALVYYSKYLRSIIRGFLNYHDFNIPEWDFNIGTGSDILGTLHYYVIGDPFSLLSVLVPVRYMYIYYDVMILARLYLAGVAFSFLCFRMGQRNKYGILAGAMAYVFCYWGIYNAARHPYFLNPMIYLPLLIIGVEKIIKKERPYLFISAVAISAVSNFYFFYMLVLVIVIYVMVRVLYLYGKNVRLIFKQIIRIGAYSVLGVLLAGVIFLPMAYTILGDARMATEKTVHLFYPLTHYDQLVAFFSVQGDSYWLCMGFSIPVFLAVCLLFHQKKNGFLKALFVICIIILIFPIFGQIFNGFSYISNRWCWAFALLVAYILTNMWPALMRISIKDAIFLFWCITAYVLACVMLEYSRKTSVFIALLFAFILLFLLLPLREGKSYFIFRQKQQGALLIVLICIFNNSFWKNADVGGSYASEAIESQQVWNELNANEASVIKEIAEQEGINTFYRYSGRNLSQNSGMLEGVSSTQYYWSLTNANVTRFRSEMGLRENTACKYNGYDDRTALISLSSVLYYAVPERDSKHIPYGFSYIDTIDVNSLMTKRAIRDLEEELQVDELSEEQEKIIRNSTKENWKIYRNEYALPLGYTYDSYISLATWDKLSAVEKQEAMLQSVVLEETPMYSKERNIVFSREDIPYNIICNSKDITVQDNEFIVTSKNAEATLTFEGMSNSETYLSINGLKFKGACEYDLYHGDENVDPLNLYNLTNWKLLSHDERGAIEKDRLFWTETKYAALKFITSEGISKTLDYYTPDHTFYNGRHNFSINFDYSENPVNTIVIKFNEIGTYTFDSIHVVCLPMNRYAEQINSLKENILEDAVLGTNTVSGSISLEVPKLLCLTIPYSVGWSAYVDGHEVPVYKANTQYMALNLDAGEHTIELIYETPLLKEGKVASAIGSVIFILLIFVIEFSKHRTKRLIVEDLNE